jgi:hypothetical protein
MKILISFLGTYRLVPKSNQPFLVLKGVTEMSFLKESVEILKKINNLCYQIVAQYKILIFFRIFTDSFQNQK